MSLAGTGNATPPDRPAFEVRTDGVTLDPLVAAAVVEIDVHEEVACHSRLSLLLQNWDPDRRRVRYSDNGPFTPGTGVVVSLGYHSDLTTVFDGAVASITAHFPTGGNPVMRVECRSRSVFLDHPPRSRQLADVSDADIAAAIAADYALATDAETGVTHDSWASDRVTDWAALTRRAAQLGWVVYVRGKTLVFRPPASQEPLIELDWTKTLVELHLTQDLTRAVESAVAVAWDLDLLEAAESEEPGSASGFDVGRRPPHDVAVRDARWPLRTARLESPAIGAPDEAGLRAVGAQRHAALGHVYGNGVIIGDPKLRCDSWISIAGAGERLSGPHYVTAARHRLSPRGYRTEFQVGIPPRLLPPLPGTPAGATTAGAGQPGAPTLVLGIVDSLDDPLSQNRVRIRFPWRDDAGVGAWARLANLDAGNGYGTVIVPSVGQEVLVGFVDNDPAVPVVLGSLYNGQQQPPLTVDQDNAVRAFVSPAGHTLKLEDGVASAVTLLSGKGHSVVLDDQASAVVLTHHESGNTIRLSGNGIELVAVRGDITLTSAAGTIALDALKLEATASGPSKIETSATFDLKAAGSLGLKGSLITIN